MNTVEKLNPTIQTILENSAWYAGRSIDINYMLEEAADLGKPISGDNIKRFLAEFSNNEIEFITPRDTISNVRLNIEAMFDFTLEELNQFDAWLKDELVPVGYIHYESAVILTGEVSGFYMIGENAIYKIGNNFFEALETIVFEKDLIRLTAK